jgi:Spy/CpxP family protein refolding chaperone
MKNKKIIYILIISLVFNVAFLGTLGYRLLKKHRYNGYRRNKYKKSAYYDKMNLTTEQRENLDQLRKGFSPRMRSLHTALMEKRKAFAHVLIEGDPDSTEIEEHLRIIGKLQNDVEREVSHQMLREKKILPREARKHYLESIAQFLKRRYGRPPDDYRRSGRRERGSEKSSDHGRAEKDTTRKQNR